MSAKLSGNPLPVIVRVSPPAMSMPSLGPTSLASNGEMTMIGPGDVVSPNASTITSNEPTPDTSLRIQVISVGVIVYVTQIVPSDNVTEISSMSSGNPLPVIVRISPPSTSISLFGDTLVASKGVITLIAPGIRSSP